MKAFFLLLRPLQWMKNLLLYFPPFLGGMFFDFHALSRGLVPFVCFCCASSFTYVLNDLVDREKDAIHPHKQFRPLAAGEISPFAAALVMAILIVLSIVGSLSVSTSFSLLLGAYIVLSTAYSFLLKNIPVVDIFSISGGFVLRLLAGGNVFKITISDWLFLSVFLLSLFLSAGKRFSEKNMLAGSAGAHRSALMLYPQGFLDATMAISGSSVLVTYTLYVITRHSLIYTVPLCGYGLLRYLFRIYGGQGGDPTDSLFRDRTLLVVTLVWVAMVAFAIYGR